MISFGRAPASEPDSKNRTDYRLQLYCLRHHHAEGDQLFRFHVLDRLVYYSSPSWRPPVADLNEKVVAGHALDPRRYQCLQRTHLRHAVQLRHFRLLRRLHLPAKRHPSPHPSMEPSRGDLRLPLDRDLATRAYDSLRLRSSWRQQSIPKLYPQIRRRLRHASDHHILHRFCTHRPYARRAITNPTHKQSVLPNPKPRLVHPLLEHQRRRRLPRHPLRHPPNHPLLLRPQRSVFPPTVPSPQTLFLHQTNPSP